MASRGPNKARLGTGHACSAGKLGQHPSDSASSSGRIYEPFYPIRPVPRLPRSPCAAARLSGPNREASRPLHAVRSSAAPLAPNKSPKNQECSQHMCASTYANAARILAPLRPPATRYLYSLPTWMARSAAPRPLHSVQKRGVLLK